MKRRETTLTITNKVYCSLHNFKPTFTDSDFSVHKHAALTLRNVPTIFQIVYTAQCGALMHNTTLCCSQTGRGGETDSESENE